MSLINKKSLLLVFVWKMGKWDFRNLEKEKELHVNNLTKSVAIILKQDR